MEIATFSKKLVRKKVLIPAIIGVGILLSAAFVLASPLESSWAQQLQQQQQHNTGMNKTVAASEYGAIPKINGSINVRDGIRNLFTENAKTPFITAAQTAQNQIANGTVLGGHISVTQGYLTYTYLVANPTNDTAHMVIVDAGNGKVLYTSSGQQMGGGGFFGPSRAMGGLFGQFTPHGLAGGFGRGLFGFGPWSTPGGFMGGGGTWH